MAASKDNDSLNTETPNLINLENPKADVPPAPILPSTSKADRIPGNNTSQAHKEHPQNDMDPAYDELLFTVQQAEKYETKETLHVQKLQLHMKALDEDMDLLNHASISDAELSKQAAQLIYRARRLRRKFEDYVADVEIEAGNVVAEVANDQTTAKTTGLKLPPLQLPTFDGTIEKFRTYRNFFEENIIHNSDLTDTAKWMRLRSTLSSHPAQLIASIPESSETIFVAWNLLVEVYGDDDRPIVDLYNKIQALPPANATTESIRLTHSTLEGFLIALKQLHHDVDTNQILRASYLGKFPLEVMYIAKPDKDTPMEEIRKNVRRIIVSRESTDQQRLATNPQAASTQQRETFRSAAPAPASTATTGQTTQAASRKPINFPRALRCIFCGGDHWNDVCSKYTTLETRKQRVSSKCQKCLRNVHEGTQCLREVRCFHCESYEHNRALCPVKYTTAPATQLALLPPAELPMMGTFLTFLVQVQSKTTQRPIVLRAVLDSAGGASLISAEAAMILNLQQSKQKTQYTGLNGSLIATGCSSEDEIHLTTEDGGTISINPAIVDGVIPDVPAANIEDFRSNFPQYNELFIPPSGRGQPVDILLGSDVMASILKSDKIKAIDADTLLLPTRFGFLIVGKQRQQNNQVCYATILNFISDPIKELSNLDVVGLTGINQSEIDDEEKAINQFYETLQFNDKRYSISWPWRVYPPQLESNYGLALGRLRTLYRKLQASPQILQEYNKIILQQITDGIVETVAEKSTSPVVHYLPHHPILRPEKEHSLRPVYDGSSKTGKQRKSLNDNIRKGTKWLNDLATTLIRFRKNKTVVIADIARAFHQISINEGDRDAARFLWLKDINKPPSPDNILILRFTRVAFGIIASPFLLHAVIKHHANQQQPSSHLQTILQDLYADNLVTTVDETVNLKEFYDYAKSFFGTMSMNLTKWTSNDAELLQYIPIDDQLQADILSVLGLQWNKISDLMSINKPKLIVETQVTVRSIAREMAVRFDPLGWASPTVLIAKTFFRKVWAEYQKWDVPLAAEALHEWKQIVLQLREIESVQLPRRLTSFNRPNQVEIHTFVDSSAQAYGVVSYLKTVQDDQTEIRLIASKSRLTPKKSVTIPKLELIAILLGYRFTDFIRSALQYSEVQTYIWTDSRCALSWIQQKKILPPVLEKYINQAKLIPITDILYVPSEQNNADVATRGATIPALRQINWWNGPDWLIDRADWPQQQKLQINDAQLLMFQTKVTYKQEIALEEEIQGVATLNIAKFPTLAKLLRRTAFCLLTAVKFKRSNFLNLQTEVDTAVALQWWIYWDQQRCYALQNEPEAGKTFLLRNISVFRDEHQIIRCQTRLLNSCQQLDTINPILLVKKSSLTKLIIMEIHVQHHHAGTSHTLANLRRTYWLPQGRREIYTTILKNCFKCRRQTAQPYPLPPIAPLPEFRCTKMKKPFEVIGVDTCGPFYTRRIMDKKLPKEKRYVLILTCAVVRAVHIEVLQNMTTDEVLLAFRRFFARRGVPRRIVSDNANQFHELDGCFANIWKQLAASKKVSIYFAEKQIVWDFIPEYSPWIGGMYERLIRSIKIAFERTYGSKIMQDRQFEASMIEIEAMLNARPISYVDRESESPILTPNDFLMSNFSAVPVGDKFERDDTILERIWKSSQAYLDVFWSHWADHYLLLLRERGDFIKNERRTADSYPQKGDIVVMVDMQKKRSAWQTAVVERMIRSGDGQIRAVQIRVGETQRYIRPITSLAPLRLIMDLPKVRDDQLNPKRDGIVVWSEGDDQMEENSTSDEEDDPNSVQQQRSDDESE